MNAANSGLILEGGGLRGVYTSGVLRYFDDAGISFPYVIGTSMGACNAANFVSKQRERNRIANTRFVNDPRYLSYWRLLTRGELFGMHFIFSTIPQQIVPFDYQTFFASKVKCLTTVTDCDSGEALYFEKNELGDHYMRVLQASCSLPFVSKPVTYKGHTLMDGGMSDSIPIRKSMADGNSKNVVILTRPRGYRKTPLRFMRLVRIRYPRHPGLCKALGTRHARYNETLDFIEALENEGKVFVIRPSADLNLGRAERNQKRLYAAYDKGYHEAAQEESRLRAYLEAAS